MPVGAASSSWQENIKTIADNTAAGGGGGGSGAVLDLSTTGTISAAQASINTPVTNATVSLTLGTGQATWKAVLSDGGGGFTSGTTIVADKSLDGGTTWFSASFKVSGASPSTPVTSVVGPGPLEITGNAAGATQIRIRCSVRNSIETIAIRLNASVGTAEIALLGSLPAGSNLVGGVNMVDSAGTNKASISAAGAVKVDGSAVTQPISGAVSISAGSSLVGGVNVIDSAGTNKLAVDASGRLTLIPNSSINLAQINGVAPGLDNTNEVRVSLYGKNSAAGDTPILVDSSGRVITTNYINGSAVSMSNPYPSADQISMWIDNGQGYSATTGLLTSPASANAIVPLCLFNPSSQNTKKIIIYSIKSSNGGGANLHEVRTTTTDPAYGSAATITNLKGGGASSVFSTTISYANANTSVTGTAFDVIAYQSNNSAEVLTNGARIIISAGTAFGVIIYTKVGTASSSWAATIKWVEV